MSSPVVSIVLPSFNGSRYLGLSVESCVQQSFGDWELIIVDDGSTDATAEIAAECARRDSRISLVRLARHQGLPAALNAGFANARGAYLTWTSDDNRYVPGAIETMWKELENDAASDIVYADHYLIDAGGKTVSIARVAEYTRLVTGNCIGPCFLYRRGVHERLRGYRADSFLVEDLDFWLRASMHFNMKRVQTPLMYYRIHGDSLTSQRKREILAITEHTIVGMLPRLAWASRDGKARGFLALALKVARQARYGSSVKYLLRAFRLAPWFCCTHIGKTLARRTLSHGERRGAGP